MTINDIFIIKMPMNYKEYKGLDYAQLGKDILEFWKENRIFEKSVEVREGAPSFTFYEGPPSANGTPGIHHVMARTIKDMFCRYKTLRGYQVKRKGGWDTHGLPIELQVEKELGIKKDDIGIKISIEDYNKKCREAVMRFTDRWLTMTEKMGYWVDMEAPYVTYKNDYIESLWWLLKQLYEKGLLYKGYTIQPYSPAAGTGLSSHELNMPGTYKDVKDTTIVAQFKIKLTGKSGYLFDAADSDDIYILAWTTTPWTLPANSALTVGKDIDYVLITTFNQYTHLPINVILAKDLVGKYFSEKGKDAKLGAYKEGDKVIPWSIVMEFKGQHLEGIQYEQLLPYVQPLEDADKAFRVILGDFVTTEDGTGVVHTAPTFGADDFRVAKANGVPGIMVRDENGKEVPIVDKQGRFVPEIGEFGGRFVKEQYYSAEAQEDPDFKPTDVLIAIKLKEENRAFKVEKYEHPYPHCWRTDKPVLYYPMDSWFIRTTALKDRLVALNNTINWHPESTGTGRFGNWLENLVDWNLSRSRYWGTPLPIWRNEEGDEKCIGSVEELTVELEKALKSSVLTDEQRAKNEAFLQSKGTEAFDLHRPYVDEIFLVSDAGKVMMRETDLIDVWFDSGAMPYAQFHFPFENLDKYPQSMGGTAANESLTSYPAHIRGGSDLGEQWYEDGKLQKKMNTFTDFIACAEHLIKEKYTSSSKLAINGGSAGGLLMGAVTNLRPDLFRVVVAEVPFVDVINTMLDSSLPLTTQEYEQWGNPNVKKDYDYMMTYSPYDNLKKANYPAILATGGLNDSQVGFHEPAKWVAKLRDLKTDNNILLLKINMDSGHGGATGRFDYLKEEAFNFAFILSQMGISN